MMRRLEIAIGSRFGRLVVVEEVEQTVLPCGKRYRRMGCICDCGAEVAVLLGNLRNRRVQSCGCFNAERTAERSMTHGQAGRGSQSANYQLWAGIKQRAVTGSSTDAARYVERGITMYWPWVDDFVAFDSWIKENLGERPEGHSLDRINNDGNYEPGNLRWATRTEQSNNTGRNVSLTLNGETKTLSQWAARAGVPMNTLRQRIFKLGWPVEKALTTPVRSPT